MPSIAAVPETARSSMTSTSSDASQNVSVKTEEPEEMETEVEFRMPKSPTKIGPTPTPASQPATRRQIEETFPSNDGSDDDDIFGFEEQETTQNAKKRKHSEDPEPTGGKRPKVQENTKEKENDASIPAKKGGFMGKVSQNSTVKSEHDEELTRSFITMEIRSLVVKKAPVSSRSQPACANSTNIKNVKCFKKQQIARTVRPISCSLLSTTSTMIAQDAFEATTAEEASNAADLTEAEDFWNFESQKSSGGNSSRKRKR